MDKKGNEFKGLAGGKNYLRFARLFGFTEKFYQEGIGNIYFDSGMKALDLGCGPGALSFALAGNAAPGAEITGIDISDDQLNYARAHCLRFNCKLDFRHCSMDELPFPDNHFDVVMSSMALHETPPKVRRAAIKETARVLKPGGKFMLVDWGKPKFGLWGIIWFPLVCFGETKKDNWKNAYPAICKENNLTQVEDGYITSIARRQVFIKGGKQQ